MNTRNFPTSHKFEDVVARAELLLDEEDTGARVAMDGDCVWENTMFWLGFGGAFDKQFEILRQHMARSETLRQYVQVVDRYASQLPEDGMYKRSKSDQHMRSTVFAS